MYKATVIGMISFEMKSLFFRMFFKCAPKLNKPSNYLNLGCARNHIKGMVNADFFPTIRFWKINPKLEWYLDLRYPLRCRDSVFDGVFSEHTLEHLYPDDALRLLKELHRVMKRGAIIRITVPDLEKYVEFYNGKLTGEDQKAFAEKFETGASAIRRMSQDFLHLSLWDFQELSRYLAIAGFVDITKKRFRECSDPVLCHDLENRCWETLYVEAKKP